MVESREQEAAVFAPPVSPKGDDKDRPDTRDTGNCNLAYLE